MAEWTPEGAVPDSEWVPEGAVAEATAAKPNPKSHRYDPPPNYWGWASPTGMMLGGYLGGPWGAARGAAAGTALDQAMNTLQHTQYAPKSSGQAAAGMWGNAALGAGSEMFPGLVGSIGKKVGPAIYKAALHVSPELADAFPKLNIGNEAWNAGAPPLSQEGIEQANAEIARRAAETRRVLSDVQGRVKTRPQSIMVAGRQRVPAMVPRDVTFELPPVDPNPPGASPTVTVMRPGAPKAQTVFRNGQQPLELPEGYTIDEFNDWWGSRGNTQFNQGPEPVQVPAVRHPFEPQYVTHRVMVPGERLEPFVRPGMQIQPRINPSVREMFESTPGLDKLVRDVGENLRGAKDEGEVQSILNDWFEKNKDVVDLNKMYTLAQKAGHESKWVSPAAAGGRNAQVAVDPNADLAGQQLRRTIMDYLKKKGQQAGLGWDVLPKRLGATQRAIAVEGAVRDAASVHNPALNVNNLGSKSQWAARLIPSPAIAEMGALMGGARPNQYQLAKMLYNTMMWSGVNAARTLPMFAQTPNDTTR